MLGAASTAEYDLTPVWWKEAVLVGSARHSIDPGVRSGPPRHSIDHALEILADGGLPPDVVITHAFGLGEYRQAVATALDRRGSAAIKVVFRPPTG